MINRPNSELQRVISSHDMYNSSGSSPHNILCMDKGRMMVSPVMYDAFCKAMFADTMNGIKWFLVERAPDANGRMCLFFDLDCKTPDGPMTLDDLERGGVLELVVDTLGLRFPEQDLPIVLILTHGGSEEVAEGVTKTGWHIHVSLKSKDHDGTPFSYIEPFVVTPLVALEIRDSLVMRMRKLPIAGRLLGTEDQDGVDLCVDNAVYRPGAGSLRFCYNHKFSHCRNTKRCQEFNAIKRDVNCEKCHGDGGVPGSRVYKPFSVFDDGASFEIPLALHSRFARLVTVSVDWRHNTGFVKGYVRDPRVVDATTRATRKKRKGKQGGVEKPVVTLKRSCLAPGDGECARVYNFSKSSSFNEMQTYIRKELYQGVAVDGPLEINYFSIRKVKDSYQLWGVVNGQYHCRNKGGCHGSSSVWFQLTESGTYQRCHSQKSFNGRNCKSYKWPEEGVRRPPPEAWRDLLREGLSQSVEGRRFLNARACQAKSCTRNQIKGILDLCGGD